MRQPSYRRFTDPAERLANAKVDAFQVGFDRLDALLEGSFSRLESRIDKFGDSLSDSFAGSSDELRNLLDARFDLSDTRFDESDAKLDLILELSAKIDWTKYRKLQLEQDKSDDSTQCI
jgi:hypothetical protein